VTDVAVAPFESLITVVMVGLAGVTVSVMRVERIREPLVPVTLSLKMPANGPALIVRLVEFPPGGSLTVGSKSWTEGPEGDIDTDMVTMPVKLFRLVRVRLSPVVPEPAIRVTEALLGARVKSTKWKVIIDVV